MKRKPYAPFYIKLHGQNQNELGLFFFIYQLRNENLGTENAQMSSILPQFNLNINTRMNNLLPSKMLIKREIMQLLV